MTNSYIILRYTTDCKKLAITVLDKTSVWVLSLTPKDFTSPRYLNHIQNDEGLSEAYFPVIQEEIGTNLDMNKLAYIPAIQSTISISTRQKGQL